MSELSNEVIDAVGVASRAASAGRRAGLEESSGHPVSGRVADAVTKIDEAAAVARITGGKQR